MHSCSFWFFMLYKGNLLVSQLCCIFTFATVLLIQINPSPILHYTQLICIVFSTTHIPKAKGIKGALKQKIPPYSARTSTIYFIREAAVHHNCKSSSTRRKNPDLYFDEEMLYCIFLQEYHKSLTDEDLQLYYLLQIT